MSISASIDFIWLKNAIQQCNANEKMELLRLLEKEIFPERFKQLLVQVKTDDLSLDQITAEVEAVRQAQYDARSH